MLEYCYNTQLPIEGNDLCEDSIRDYLMENFQGDCLFVVGGAELIRIYLHTDAPWDVLKYHATLEEIYDIAIEDMDRQSRSLRVKASCYWKLECHLRFPPFFYDFNYMKVDFIVCKNKTPMVL